MQDIFAAVGRTNVDSSMHSLDPLSRTFGTASAASVTDILWIHPADLRLAGVGSGPSRAVTPSAIVRAADAAGKPAYGGGVFPSA